MLLNKAKLFVWISGIISKSFNKLEIHVTHANSSNGLMHFYSCNAITDKNNYIDLMKTHYIFKVFIIESFRYLFDFFIRNFLIFSIFFISLIIINILL